MNRDEIINELAAQIAQLGEGQKSVLQSTKELLQAEIDRVDYAWLETERKHQSALKESRSDSWTRSLLMSHNQRQEKYVAIHSSLTTQLSDLPEDIGLPPIGFEEIRLLLDEIDTEISKYQSDLSIKRRQLEFLGDYGSVEKAKWLSETSRFAEINPGVSRCLRVLQDICNDIPIGFDWQNYVTSRIDEKVSPAEHLPAPVVSDGVGFEYSCLATLEMSGWKGNLTKSSGDQGVDIIARKDNCSVAIQCKNYKTPVGNGAVQEVHAGKSFYETDFAVVVSPSGFTASAIQLGRKLGVLLVDPSTLDTLEKALHPDA
jgi:restriction system protein